MGRRQGVLADVLRPIRQNIYTLCRVLDFHPTKQQRELLDAVQRGDKTIACKSGQGPGKTKVGGVIALWWALQKTGAKVVVSAPTMRQCRDVYLAELKRTLDNAPTWFRRFFEITASHVVVAGDRDWGVQTMTATKDEAAQGFHHPNLKIIVEEASGVERKIIEQFQGTLKNPDSGLLLIGNPNTRDCFFFDCFNTKRDRWTTITFNAEDTPLSEWFDPAKNKELEEEYGRESDFYRIRVLGEFPFSDPNCVLSSEDLEYVIDKTNMLYCVRLSSRKQIGGDFARFGGDENTLFRRSGEAIVQWGRWPHTDPARVVETAFAWQAECGWQDRECRYVMDAGGIGQGVLHKFHDAGKDVVEFHFGGSAGSAHYANRITEAYFQFRKKVRKAQQTGSPTCYIPNDPITLQQLTTRRYFTNLKGKLILEKKEDYEKRGHKSPDRADGLVLAMYDGQTGTEGAILARR